MTSMAGPIVMMLIEDIRDNSHQLIREVSGLDEHTFIYRQVLLNSWMCCCDSDHIQNLPFTVLRGVNTQSLYS
jgi:hypothetical protein